MLLDTYSLINMTKMTSDKISSITTKFASSAKSMVKLFSIVLTLLFTISANATDSTATSIPRISIITCHAGKQVYELCGHTAIRVQLGESIDRVINYGMFDFDTPNFVYRFVSGQTDYFVADMPFIYFTENYQRENRQIVEQELNLTPQQARKLIYLLAINLRPENRYYRYNYVKNNCATLPINVIEKAIGQPILFGEPQIDGAQEWTFRQEMRHFHKNYPWYQFGIDLALGSGIDYKLSTREKGFAPEALQQMLSIATITDSTGNTIPLVKQTKILNAGAPNGAQLRATPWIQSPMCASLIIFCIVLSFTILDIKRCHTTRWLDSLLFLIFAFMGCVITFLVFKSTHEATSPNWLIVWLNPIAFIPAIGIWLKKCKFMVLCYHFANFVALFLLIIIWNWIEQVANVAFWPLILCSLMRSASYIYTNKCVKRITA